MSIKGYKGFNKDMTCRGFQYKEGKEYHEERAELCNSGFHACEAPLDCFVYYPPAKSVYHEVELRSQNDAAYVRRSDVLDLITEAYEGGSFTDYSDYSSLWDAVDDMPGKENVDNDT